jgi:hypothetical protein
MGASLNQPCRVEDEGVFVVNFFGRRRNPRMRPGLTVSEEQAPANSVPAAAVIRRVQALSGFTGFKGSAGGRVSQR